MTNLPAILGGKKAFEKSMSIIRPNYDLFVNEINKKIELLSSGISV